MTRKTIAILCTATGLVAAGVLTAARAPAGPRTHVHDPAGACNVRGAPPADAKSGLPFGDINAAFARARVLPGGGEAFVSVDITTRSLAPTGPRPALRLAMVIDRSGSMMSEDKLERAKQAAAGIVARLLPGDHAALVQYDHVAELLVPLTGIDGGGRERLQAAIAGIHGRGSTNLNGGLELGWAQLTGITATTLNRLILLSDGLANVGVVDPGAIASGARGAADRGVRITTIGLGVDYNEDLMEAIAESGRGQYYYVRDAAGLERVFAQELNALQATVATGVELRMEPACSGVELLDVPGYKPRRDGRALVVPMADLTGGESRRLLVKVRLPALATGTADALRLSLAWSAPDSHAPATAALALGIEVTDDARASDASVNRDVMAAVLQVETAEAMRRASVEYEQGRAEEARRILAEKQARLLDLGNTYALPADQIQAPVQQMQRQSAGISSYAPGSFGGKGLIKSSKSAARGWTKSKVNSSLDDAF